MLQRIRDRIHGWLAGLIVVVVTIAFVIWGLQYYLRYSSGKEEVVASVNGKKISKQQFVKAFTQIQRSQFGDKVPDEQTLIALQQFALEQVTTESALLQSETKNGFIIGQDQVKQMIASIPEFQEQGQFSAQRYQQVLAANNMTPNQFFQRVQNMVMMQQIVNGIQKSAIALPTEIKHAYELFHEQRQFGYFLIPAKNFIAQMHPSEEEINNYYQQHLPEFKSADKVKLQYIVLLPKELQANVKVSEQQMQQYYRDNLAQFAKPKRWQIALLVIKTSLNDQQQQKLAQQQLAELKRQLSKGKTFDELMKKNVTGQEHSVEWISADQASPALRKVLSQLKIGKVSAPFDTPVGPALVQLKAQQTAQTADFAQVKDRIKQTLIRQQIDQLMSEKSEKLTDLAYSSSNSLDAAAKVLGLPIKESDWINKSQLATQEKNPSEASLLRSPKVIAAAYSQEVLQGSNSEPIELSDGSLIVLRVLEHQPSKQLSLAEVHSKIDELLKKQMSARAAGLQAYELQNAIQKRQPIATLAQRYHLQWQNVPWVERTVKTIPETIVKAVFSLASSTQNPKPVTSVLLSTGDYAVLQLDGVRAASFSQANETERTKFHNDYTNYLAQLYYQFYVQSVKSSMKIKIMQENR